MPLWLDADGRAPRGRSGVCYIARVPKPRPHAVEPGGSASHDDALSLRSRTDGRRAERAREDALEELASDLVRMRPTQLDGLLLDETLRDAVDLARAIKSRPALQRQIRAIRIALRGVDWWALRSAVDHLREHGTLATRRDDDGVERAWVVRLLGEGGIALDELVREHPKADRSRLRTLIRNTQKASADRRIRAERELARVVREILAD
jgi:ribosome-associated protein